MSARAAWLVAIASAVATAGVARAEGQCDSAYEEGQMLRRSGRLIEARTRFEQCAKPACAQFEVADCTRWSAEMTASIASIVVRARDPQGGDVPDASVFVDDVPHPESANGTPIEIDPGRHVLRAMRAGSPPAIKELVVAAGDRKHEVVLTIEPTAPPSPPAPPAATATTASAATSPHPPLAEAPAAAPSSPSRTPLYVVGGIGIAALVAGAVLDAKGYFGDTRPLESCAQAHDCNADQQATARSAKTELLVGDVLVGAGVVAVAVAAWLYFHSGAARAPQQGEWRSGLRVRF